MPQHEFELYLKLLANLLDLAPSQREEIRDEMRDHLEERLAELAKLGVSREEAIERALDEFGDAAGLAGSFTKLARERQRRRLMYRTTGTAVAVTLVLLTAAALWPDGRGNNAVGPVFIGAQDAGFGGAAPGNGAGDFGGGEGGSEGPMRPAAPPLRPDPGAVLRAEVEAALDKPVAVQFFDVPFDEAAEQLADQIGIDLVYDRTFFEDSGLDTTTPVTLDLKRKIPARVAFDLILHDLGDGGCVAREGFVYVTSMLETLQLEVYDVRDLTGRGNSTPRPMPQPGSGGEFLGGSEGYEGDAESYGEAGGFGGGGGMAMGGDASMYGGGSSMPGAGGNERANVDALVNVILTHTAHDTWQDVGAAGTISAFDGLLVVRNTPQAHREVRQLLEMLRAANAGAPGQRRERAATGASGFGSGADEGFSGEETFPN